MISNIINEWKHTDCVISFENTETKVVQTITGKNARITSMQIDMPLQDIECYSLYSKKSIEKIKPIEPTTITFTLKVLNDNMIHEWFDYISKPNIRNKKVEDCTIQELLFAIRNKIK